MNKFNLENLTLKEVSNICLQHQLKGKDCETCPLFVFCNYQLTINYPSGWKLKEEESKIDCTKIKK